jgi:parallel beta-helix repeat protein
MKTTRFCTFFFFFLLILHHSSEAKLIQVPEDYDSIQKAIDASRRNDIIQVRAGTYYENITLKDGRHLIGDGAEVTFIIDDGKGAPDPVVYIDGDVTLRGFTITGGRGAGVGHAVMVTRGSPRIINSIVRDNSYTGIGLHSEVQYSAPIIVGNKIFGNGGAGIANLGHYSKSVILKNEIFNNTNVGIACTDHAQPLIMENNIHDNGAGVAVKDEANVEIFKNLIVGNKLVGINISKKAKGTIRNNNILTNGSTGVNIDQSLLSILEKNTIVDNGAEGIFVKNHSEATIHNNIIAGNLPTILQVDKSTATLTKNQVYTHDTGGMMNMQSIRYKSSQIFAGGNEVVGGIDDDEFTKITELSPEEYTPSPPSLPLPKEENASSQITSDSPPVEHSKEEQPSSSEKTPVTKPKPADSRGCLFFF